MSSTILLAGPEGLLAQAPNHLTGCTLLTAADGAQAFEAFVRALASGQQPAIVVLELTLERIGGIGMALAIRAIERAFAAPPTPLLFYSERSADDEVREVLAEVGQAVHLDRPNRLSPADQAARLDVAVGRLLEQLGGR